MRLREGPTHSFQPPSSVHSSLGSHVYTFSNGTAEADSSSEEEFDVMELRARGGEQQRINASREKVGNVILLERAITEDDNLNKLALQYGCKVSDIKRVNNLITDQDIYALKTIKIPVKVHGLLTERRDELTAFNASAPPEPEKELSLPSMESRDFTVYFKAIDQNIEEAAAQTHDLFNESFALDSPSLPPTRILGQKQPASGADWGIRWWNAVFIMLLVGIVLPVFYIVYFKTQGDSEGTFSIEGRTNVSTSLSPHTNTGHSMEQMTQRTSGFSPGLLQDTHKLLNPGG
ncbi:lysM and putative peptidoglycan-binding domain-containing protein 4 isoform X2 [Xenopus laevis]|uniref:LysM and putative peptidoglycan-binding domain-containing protein 4 n=3 Tax=Xenopus laevis TaxID=8355 RepID=LYSM4_XENLA|nr:lysM and putative peptidoglycan-binding domain-containing protein 4 [Xenopus laevis]XP_018106538.1 lysM and putative peptidoglycan-binding domain-containing protein 4 isoform X2 [Xenopus laevis]Q6DCC7.1 RecName: Full=LysM and putative peptidoglycan-binding domain-containing protein 4 [Xenopus laevis]AAH78121.1 MGC83644 protein [Xenopus laevis]OCT89794.1 hypothetical protein XELAEV_18018407mg [Xenopus laevis]